MDSTQNVDDRLRAALADRYAIESAIGSGGMATVYLAQDLKHDRKVAVKVLRPELAAVLGAERFLSEIKVTANLQHPHILPLHDSGEADGFLYYVMPFIEGESLRAKLDREKQLSVEEAVGIASSVASALDYAHRHGVIHRDIKPANILLHDGQPMVTDFGIALAVRAAGGERLTETGLSLGTPQYMSPEQASGDREVDGRSDLYSLGCVLYEMLAGEPPHSGPTVQAVIAKLLTDKPRPVTELRETVPAHVAATVHKALAKLPADRFGSAAEVVEYLDDPSRSSRAVGTSDATSGPVSRRPALSRAVWTAVGLAVGAIGALALLKLFGGLPVSEQAATRYFSLDPPPGVELPYDRLFRIVALSRDGRWLAFVGDDNGRRLYLDDLHDADPPRIVEGSEGGGNPFFSPDGQLLGFGTETELKVVSVAGGEPRSLAQLVAFSGGTWTPNGDTIYYSPSSEDGLLKVAVEGGEPVEVTVPARDGFDNNHRYPEMLPGGKKLIYTSAYGRHRLMLLDLETGKVTPILENQSAFSATYANSGYLLYAQASGSLMAVEFDPQTLETGVPVEVARDVVVGNELQAQYSLSESGTLVYLEGISSFRRNLMRLDRDGTERLLETGGPRPVSLTMEIDSAGEWLALTLWDGQQDVYLYDLDREVLSPLITDPHNDFVPVWTRGGDRIAFTSVRNGTLDLYTAESDRGGVGTPLLETDGSKWPTSWSPGDSLLAFVTSRKESSLDIWIYSVAADSAWAFLAGPETAAFARFSPDGAWIAYEKGGPGLRDVYVAPFPGPGRECKVSTAGGYEPRWTSNGDRLFYREGNRAMVADVADRDFCNAESTEFATGVEDFSWAPSPDGEYIITVQPRPEPRLRMVENFSSVLTSLASGGGS